MKNFHIKSLLLGIGIGIVITSILSLVYFAGSDPVSRLTEQEIIKEAEKYGMVKNTSLISTNTQKTILATPTPAPVVSPTPIPTPVALPTPTPQVVQEQPIPEEIKLVIKNGDACEVVAEKLQELGLITDKLEFIEEMKKLKLTSRIRIGEYLIRKGLDNLSIIKIITT